MSYNQGMQKIKDELLRLKPLLILISFSGLVLLFVMNFSYIIGTISQLFSYLSVFFYGLVMAFVINIPMTSIEKKLKKLDKNNLFCKHSRGFSLFIAVILVLAIVILVMMIVVPEIVESLMRIIGNLGNYFSSLINNITDLLAYLNIDFESLENLDFETFLAKFDLTYQQLLQTGTNLIVGTGMGTVSSIFNIGTSIFNFTIGFFICLYLLGSKEDFIRQTKKLVCITFRRDIAKEILHYMHKTNDIFRKFIGGKFIELIVVWVMMYILLLLFNIQYAILVSSMCALAVIIPYFGALIVTIFATVLLLSVDPMQALIFFIIYQIVQNIDGNLIYPRIMDDATGLPAVWILVSVFFFGGLFGPFGMLIAVPLTACIYLFITEIVRDKLKEKGIEIEYDTSEDDI